jgi:hypothetical protein
MPDLPAAFRIFIETLALQTVAVISGLLLATALAVGVGAACRLCGRPIR